MQHTYNELECYIPMEVPGKGKGFAMAVLDYGQEHHLLWVIAMDDTGEIWIVANPEVRVQNNWTMGRMVRPPEKVQGGYHPPTSVHGARPTGGSGVQPPRCPKPTTITTI